jgi:hypothetical protein
MGKIGQISTEGKSLVDILNAVSQEGKLDANIPKRTITKETGKIETIFVFDFGENHQKTFDEFQNYFMKEEGFLMMGQQENNAILGRELQKGTTKLLLVKKGSIVVEDRMEGFLVVAKPPKVENPITSKLILIVIAVIIVIGVFVAPRFLKKKK